MILSKLLLPFALVVLVGCATNTNPKSNSTNAEVWAKFNTENYQGCILEIESRLKSTSLSPANQSELLLIKGMCLEEEQNGQAANAIYKKIMEIVPNTSISDHAAIRLMKCDGDQKTRFQADWLTNSWRRTKFQASSRQVEATYVPAGKNFKNTKKIVTLFATDRGREITSLNDVIKRMSAILNAQNEPFQTERIDNALQDDGMWYCKTSKEGSAVIRAVVTLDRVCIILYANKNGDMTAEEKESAIQKLNDSRLVSSH